MDIRGYTNGPGPITRGHKAISSSSVLLCQLYATITFVYWASNTHQAICRRLAHIARSWHYILVSQSKSWRSRVPLFFHYLSSSYFIHFFFMSSCCLSTKVTTKNREVCAFFGMQRSLRDCRLPLLNPPLRCFNHHLLTMKQTHSFNRQPQVYCLMFRHYLPTFIPCALTSHNFWNVLLVNVVRKLRPPPTTSVDSRQKNLSEK